MSALPEGFVLRRHDTPRLVDWSSSTLKITPNRIDSKGEWELQTPIGELLLRKRGAQSGWEVIAAYSSQPIARQNDLRVWIEATGLGEVSAPTRRELIEIIAQTIERYPKTPEETFREEYAL